MGRTVGELQRVVSSEEFTEWQGFFCVEPYGSQPEDVRAAMICRTVAQAMTSRAEPYKVSEFMPEWTPRSEPTMNDLRSKFMMAGKMVGEINAARRQLHAV